MRKITNFLKKNLSDTAYKKLKNIYHIIKNPIQIGKKISYNLEKDKIYNDRIFESLHLNIEKIKQDLKNYNYDYSDPYLSWHYHLFAGLSQNYKNINILEIGTSHGKFTNFLSNIFQKSNIITCDLPQDSDEFKTAHNIKNKKELENFLIHRRNNLRNKNIKLLELDSVNLLNNFNNQKFDLIWIDGDHMDPQVSIDIYQSITLTKPTGIICCDDILKYDEKMVKASSDSFKTLNFLEEKNILKNKFILKRINLDNAHFKKFICISRKC